MRPDARVHGMVDREIALGFDDLLARLMIERDITIACVSNVGGPYVGTRVASVRPSPTSSERPASIPMPRRSFHGPLTDSPVGTPTAVVMDGSDAMLAVSMNGEPRRWEHGLVRMLVPGLYGYVSAMKWLVDLELTTLDAYDAYWIERGWAKEAPIKTQSRIDTPGSGAEVASGPVPVAGVAWAQHRSIDRVEVRVDDGACGSRPSWAWRTDYTWRQWVYRWDATPGFPRRRCARPTGRARRRRRTPSRRSRTARPGTTRSAST